MSTLAGTVVAILIVLATLALTVVGVVALQSKSASRRVLVGPDEHAPLVRPTFTIVMRGYDCAAVDEYVQSVLAGVASAPPDFPVVMRSYSREEVDAWVAAVSRRRPES